MLFYVLLFRQEVRGQRKQKSAGSRSRCSDVVFVLLTSYICTEVRTWVYDWRKRKEILKTMPFKRDYTSSASALRSRLVLFLRTCSTHFTKVSRLISSLLFSNSCPVSAYFIIGPPSLDIVSVLDGRNVDNRYGKSLVSRVFIIIDCDEGQILDHKIADLLHSLAGIVLIVPEALTVGC